jgi:hypothetical protein
MNYNDMIIQTIREDYPDTQAIYLAGSWGTADELPESDVIVAALLPPVKAKDLRLRDLSKTKAKLADLLHKQVELLNLRRISTVFQKEVIMADRRIYTGDETSAEVYEMLTLSFYKKLKEEWPEMLVEELRSSGIDKPDVKS